MEALEMAFIGVAVLFTVVTLVAMRLRYFAIRGEIEDDYCWARARHERIENHEGRDTPPLADDHPDQ